ncbi:MAG: putative addiction module antidote protein [Chloroflexi bacterium]|nr:putative addiction module antidote protein [Chloroflexota bacterium]
MAIRTKPFDAAEFLDTDESRFELIADAFESGSQEYLLNAINTVARAEGMTQVARKAGITREALYKAFSSAGNPTLSTMISVLKALDLKLSVVAENTGHHGGGAPAPVAFRS